MYHYIILMRCIMMYNTNLILKVYTFILNFNQYNILVCITCMTIVHLKIIY